MPPRPPALARIASTRPRARASMRRSAMGSRAVAVRKPAANSSSGGAYGAWNVGGFNVGRLNVGRLAAKLFIAGSASLAHKTAVPLGWPAACILRQRALDRVAAKEYRPRTTRLRNQSKDLAWRLLRAWPLSRSWRGVELHRG